MNPSIYPKSWIGVEDVLSVAKDVLTTTQSIASVAPIVGLGPATAALVAVIDKVAVRSQCMCPLSIFSRGS